MHLRSSPIHIGLLKDCKSGTLLALDLGRIWCAATGLDSDDSETRETGQVFIQNWVSKSISFQVITEALDIDLTCSQGDKSRVKWPSEYLPSTSFCVQYLQSLLLCHVFNFNCTQSVKISCPVANGRLHCWYNPREEINDQPAAAVANKKSNPSQPMVFDFEEIWVFPKIGGKIPQIDGLFHGKPLFFNGWFGGCFPPPLFLGWHPIYSRYSH